MARTDPMIRPRKSHGKSIAIAEGAGGGGVCACAIITAMVRMRSNEKSTGKSRL